jgi:multicomponent K+:H+ antiporter subunit C
MEGLVAAVIGLLTAAGVWLTLRPRSFDVILGLSFMSYAVNVFLFSSGRLAPGLPPIIDPAAAGYSDPLPQALVLTAIVISFGMTAVLVIMAVGTFLRTGSDSTGSDSTDDRDPS